jgi:hypothetical protein
MLVGDGEPHRWWSGAEGAGPFHASSGYRLVIVNRSTPQAELEPSLLASPL